MERGVPGVDDLKCLIKALNWDDRQDGTKDLPTTQSQNLERPIHIRGGSAHSVMRESPGVTPRTIVGAMYLVDESVSPPETIDPLVSSNNALTRVKCASVGARAKDPFSVPSGKNSEILTCRQPFRSGYYKAHSLLTPPSSQQPEILHLPSVPTRTPGQCKSTKVFHRIQPGRNGRSCLPGQNLRGGPTIFAWRRVSGRIWGRRWWGSFHRAAGWLEVSAEVNQLRS